MQMVVMAPPKTKMVKAAMTSVVWRMARESVMPSHAGLAAAASRVSPPHDVGKSMAA